VSTPAPLLPVLAAAATGVQVGAAIVATRFVVDLVEPVPLAFLRYALGFACLLPPALLALPRLRAAAAGRWRDLLPLTLLGVAQFALVVVLLNYGLRHIPAARAALLFATLPLLTLAVAAALGRERATAAKLLGVLLTLAGVAVALGPEVLRRGLDPADWAGEAAVLGAALAGAVCSVLYQPYLRRWPVLPLGAYAMLASVAVLGVLAAARGFFAQVPTLPAEAWAAVLFVGASSGLGYWLWLWALRHSSPTRVTVFLSLSPVTAALLGALLLGEPVTPAAVAGFACIALGLRVAFRGG